MTAPRVMPTSRPLRGMALVSTAVMAFALSDVVMKHLSANYLVPAIIAVRCMVNLVMLTLILGLRLGRGLWQTCRTGLAALHVLSLDPGSLSMGLALRLMPLGEWVTVAGWAGATAGFPEVLRIMRTG